MKKYEPKSGFVQTDDASLVYNLMPNGTYRKGEMEWANDVAVSIRAPRLTPEQRKDIADTIQSALNEKYPHNAEPIHPETKN